MRRAALLMPLMVVTFLFVSPHFVSPHFVSLGQAQEGWLPKTTAELILLDKIRAQPSTLTVKVGDNGTFGSLTIHVRSCVIRPPDQPADAAAFIDVTDSRGTKDVFKGWVLENTPAVSQMEHALYDLRLAACH